MRNKVTIIGAGHVGATTAQRIILKDLADVVLIDIDRDLPRGKAMDLAEAAPIERTDAEIIGLADYEAAAGSDVVVVCAGHPRKPGMLRSYLLEVNAAIVREIVEKVAVVAPEAVLIVVTNPIDLMCQVALKYSGFPENRVVGFSSILDATRFRSYIAETLNVSVENTHALVVGPHSADMVPLPRYCSVAGIPITELLTPEQIEVIIEKTRSRGSQIVELLKTGGAYYAPASGIAEMVEAIIKDKRKIISCSAHVDGQYGLNPMFIGLPVILGANGVEKIVELDLNAEEMRQLRAAASSVRSLTYTLEEIGY